VPHHSKPATSQTRLTFGAIITALTIYTVFILPFHFPPHIPVRSEAYAAGFSNKVAEIAAALLSLMVLAYTLRFTRTKPPEENTKLSRTWLYAAVTTAVLITLALGTAVVRSQNYFGESEYFVTQLQTGLLLHQPLYTGVQFAYGPALYGWAALCIRALAPFGIGLYTAYVTALVLMQAVGFALFFCVVNALPIPRSLRAFTYAALAFGSLSPTLGLNYSLFRFAAPMAAMLLLTRQKKLLHATIISTLAVIASFAISSEIGIASIGGVIAYATFRAWLSGLRWAALALAAFAGTALFTALMGPAYFLTLRNAGTGGFDLLLTPEPRTLFYLITVIALAPIAVARHTAAVRQTAATRRDSSTLATTGLLVALYGLTLGLIPVALGRCDAIHEYFFGLPATILSIVAISPARTRLSKLWIAAVIASVLMTQRANLNLSTNPLINLRQDLVHPTPDPIDTASLKQTLANHQVFITDGLPYRTNQALLNENLIAPAFYFRYSAIWRREDEQRKLNELRQNDYALSPALGLAEPTDFSAGSPSRWRRFGLIYPQRQPPFEPGQLLDTELNQNWQPLQTYGDYTLYRRLH
jgi:hypothetical protein